MIEIEDLKRDFLSFFPEFAVTRYSEALVMRSLAEADDKTSASAWGQYAYAAYRPSTKARGLFYLAAHLIDTGFKQAKATSAGITAVSASKINSKSVSKLSVSFDGVGSQNLSEEFLRASSYGQQFAIIRNEVSIGAFSV